MTEKNIFIYKIFLLWNVSHFIFLSIKNPLEKVTTFLSQQPPSEIKDLRSPHFLKI